MKYLLTRDAHVLFESQSIGFMKLVTKYRDDFKGLIESISSNAAGSETHAILNPKSNTGDPETSAGTPENKAAVERIMQPIYSEVMAMIDRMAYDNKMSQAQVIMSLYDKMDSGLMNAIITIAKPFAKGSMIDQGVLNALFDYLSKHPKLAAIPVSNNPKKPILDPDGKPSTVSAGSMIGGVVNSIIAKLGMVRNN